MTSRSEQKDFWHSVIYRSHFPKEEGIIDLVAIFHSRPKPLEKALELGNTTFLTDVSTNSVI